MKSSDAALIRLLNSDKVIFVVEDCEKCGSSQKMRDGDNCFGCEVEAVTGLRFNQAVAECLSHHRNSAGERFLSLEHYHNQKHVGNAARRSAKATKKHSYYGEACERCGCNLRLTVTGECHSCTLFSIRWNMSCGDKQILARERCRQIISGRTLPIYTMHMDREVRKLATELGYPVYNGMPCSCLNTKRYTLRGQCTCCVKQRNGSRKSKPAEAGLSFDHLF